MSATTAKGCHPPAAGDEKVLLDATLAATDLVIASPLYWFSVSTSVKLYLDHWSGWMRIPGVDFRDRMRGKTMWAITAHTAKQPAEVEPLLGTLRLTADYLNMNWGGELLAYGNRPGEAPPTASWNARANCSPAERPQTKWTCAR